MEGKGAGHRKVDHRFCGNPEEEEQLGLLLGARLLEKSFGQPGGGCWRRRIGTKAEESSAPGLNPAAGNELGKGAGPNPEGHVCPDGVRIYPLYDGDPVKGLVQDALVSTRSSEN